jgi:hypothetical protein
MQAVCFTQHTATRYTCPICSKSLTDMSAWYRGLDGCLEILPAEDSRVCFGATASIVYVPREYTESSFEGSVDSGQLAVRDGE